MNNIEIYVKTSTLGVTGIHWRKVLENNETESIVCPPLLTDEVEIDINGKKTILENLLDEVSPSLLVYRSEKKILLEITGIQSLKRTEKVGRKVLSNLLIIAPETEIYFLKMTHVIIKNFLYWSENDDNFSIDFDLKQIMEESVDFHEKEQFKVDRDILVEKFIKQFYKETKKTIGKIPEYEIVKKSPDALQEILKIDHFPETWKNYNGETKTDGILILITNYLNGKHHLHYAGVWRGIATNIEEPIKPEENNIGEDVPESPQINETKEIEGIKGKKRKKNSQTYIIILIVTILIVVVSLVIWNKNKEKQPQQSLIHQEETCQTMKKWHPPCLMN